MEIHRLKEMQDDYDEELFNKIYKDCSKLMDKLTYHQGIATIQMQDSQRSIHPTF